MKTNVEIEVIELTEYLLYFYWGRHADDPMIDMRLGGGSFALYKGDKAIVIDTMARTGQGAWVKNYLQEKYQIKQFTLITSHWHVDHMIDNVVYADTTIIGLKRTREVMLERKADFEAGKYHNYDPFPVMPPNLVFEGSLALWLDDLKIELHEYLVHEEGHLGVYLPDQKIFIANDILEDPIWFFAFDFASPGKQLSELERLMAQEIDVIYPCHGSIDVIKNGGYDKALIQANMAYLREMLATVGEPEFDTKPATAYIEDALQSGVLHWWEPYSEVHASNKKMLLESQQ